MDTYRRTFSRNIPTGPSAKLRIKNRNGKTRIRAHDRDEIIISAVAELWAQSPEHAERELQRIADGITAEGNNVEVRTPEHSGFDFDMDVDVDVDVNVGASASSGSSSSGSRERWLPFTLRGVTSQGESVDIRVPWPFWGPFSPEHWGRGWGWRAPTVDYDISAPKDTVLYVLSRNGDVESSDISGPIEIESRNGHISVSDPAGTVKANSRNGHVSLARCGADVTANSRNDHITIEGAAGPVVVETRNGAIEISDAGETVRAITNNGAVRYRGSVRGDFTIETSNGSVTMTVPADSRFEVDAESSRGSVRSDLRVHEQGEANGPRPKVRIRSRLGSIRIREL